MHPIISPRDSVANLTRAHFIMLQFGAVRLPSENGAMFRPRFSPAARFLVSVSNSQFAGPFVIVFYVPVGPF